MQNAQLNLQPITPRISDKAESQRVEDEFHSSDLLEQTRSEIRGMRMLTHHQQETYDRRTRIFTIIVGMLILAFLATLWLAYPMLRDQKTSTKEIVGLKNVAGGLGKRMDSVQSNVDRMTTGLPNLVDQFQTNMKAEVQIARDQAGQIERRVMANVNQSIQGIQSRLTGVESTQRESQEHVNQLQTQIVQLNQELANVREQASASVAEIKQLKDQQDTSSRDFTGLNQRVSTNQAAVTNLTNRVDHQRVEFQVSNRAKTAQITPGIDVTVKHIDAGKQEVDLLMQMGGKNGDLLVRGQGIRKPVLFYMPDGNRKVELVITQIAKDSIAGYLLMPLPARTGAQ
jgi:cell division protein FtsB